MQIIFCDESGINYKTDEFGEFTDGPFIFYGGICVDDKKYFHLERLFLDLIKHYFSIEDWQNIEIKGSDMWARKGYFNGFELNHIKSFFDELFQLLAKLRIIPIIGFCEKSKTNDNSIKKQEEIYAINSFFQSAERYLAKISETGIIVADTKTAPSESLFSSVFRSRSNWRVPFTTKEHIPHQHKYQFESKICFLLDEIHYVDSKTSLFIQMADIYTFIFRRVWTYQYLRKHFKSAAKEKVPIEKDNFLYYLNETVVCFFNNNDFEFLNYNYSDDYVQSDDDFLDYPYFSSILQFK